MKFSRQTRERVDARKIAYPQEIFEYSSIRKRRNDDSRAKGHEDRVASPFGDRLEGLAH
jgi:hypothetical protein